MATTKYSNVVTLVEVRIGAQTCSSCGLLYGLASDFYELMLRDGRTFYCPNGHTQVYEETEADRLRKELAQAKQRIEAERGWTERLTADLDSERKSHASTKGQLTKTRNRANAGVCLECHRSFPDVAKHQRDKHGGSDAATGKRQVSGASA